MITYDAEGVPEQFTIKVGGFKAGDLVAVTQCDGLAPTDPDWVVTTNCDTATGPAKEFADKDGVVTFPANDRNFGFQPVRGQSPQGFFNCVPRWSRTGPRTGSRRSRSARSGSRRVT